ncbi:hypothetical protein CS542_09985 [Pedobacter sp. IW39]|nr:hypothetical protein CS542_09985 [Pedobacter sp. IW39]
MNFYQSYIPGRRLETDLYSSINISVHPVGRSYKPLPPVVMKGKSSHAQVSVTIRFTVIFSLCPSIRIRQQTLRTINCILPRQPKLHKA